MSHLVPRGSDYTDEQRQQAVAHYLLHGNARETERACSIPRSTLQQWMATEWWEDIAAQLRQQISTEQSSGLSRIISKAIAAVEDRIDNGDTVVTKTGELVQKPISGKDAAIIAAVCIDKRIALEGRPAAAIASEARLEAIAKRLAALPGADPSTLKVIECKAEDK